MHGNLFQFTPKLQPEALEAAITARLDLYGKYGLIVDGELRDENDYTYSCPTTGQLVDLILSRRDILEKKASHGFTDLEIGLGVSGKQQIGALRTAITNHAENLKSIWGLSLGETDTPVCDLCDYWYNNPDEEIVYRHGTEWVRKADFYGLQPFPGLHLAFVRPEDDEMARKGEGGRTIGDRPNLIGGVSPLDQYDLFGTGEYRHESPFTVDLAMARMLQSIEVRQVVPHVYSSNRGTTAWCSRNRFGTDLEKQEYIDVPYLYWDADCRVINLHRHWANTTHSRFAAPAAVGIEE